MFSPFYLWLAAQFLLFIVPIYVGDTVLAKQHLVIKELVFIEGIIEIMSVRQLLFITAHGCCLLGCLLEMASEWL